MKSGKKSLTNRTTNETTSSRIPDFVFKTPAARKQINVSDADATALKKGRKNFNKLFKQRKSAGKELGIFDLEKDKANGKMKPMGTAHDSGPFQDGAGKSNIFEEAPKQNAPKVLQSFLPTVKSQFKFGSSAFPQFAPPKSTSFNFPKPSFQSTPIQPKPIPTSRFSIETVSPASSLIFSPQNLSAQNSPLHPSFLRYLEEQDKTSNQFSPIINRLNETEGAADSDSATVQTKNVTSSMSGKPTQEQVLVTEAECNAVEESAKTKAVEREGVAEAVEVPQQRIEGENLPENQPTMSDKDATAGGEDLEGAEGDEEDDFGLLMEFFPGIKNFEPSDTAIASDSFFNPDFGLESQDQPEGQRREPTPLNPPIDGLDDNLQQNSDNCDDILVLNANTQIVRNTQITGLINSNEFVAGFVEIKMECDETAVENKFADPEVFLNVEHWEERISQSLGIVYYYNSKTGENLWPDQCPPGFIQKMNELKHGTNQTNAHADLDLTNTIIDAENNDTSVCSPLLNAPENIESEPTRECDMDIANPDDTIPEFRAAREKVLLNKGDHPVLIENKSVALEDIEAFINEEKSRSSQSSPGSSSDANDCNKNSPSTNESTSYTETKQHQETCNSAVASAGTGLEGAQVPTRPRKPVPYAIRKAPAHIKRRYKQKPVDSSLYAPKEKIRTSSSSLSLRPRHQIARRGCRLTPQTPQTSQYSSVNDTADKPGLDDMPRNSPLKLQLQRSAGGRYHPKNSLITKRRASDPLIRGPGRPKKTKYQDDACSLPDVMIIPSKRMQRESTTESEIPPIAKLPKMPHCLVICENMDRTFENLYNKYEWYPNSTGLKDSTSQTPSTDTRPRRSCTIKTEPVINIDSETDECPVVSSCSRTNELSAISTSSSRRLHIKKEFNNESGKISTSTPSRRRELHNLEIQNDCNSSSNYHCMDCLKGGKGRSFSAEATFERHMFKEHKIIIGGTREFVKYLQTRPPDSFISLNYRCNPCDKDFPTIEEWNSHNNQVHAIYWSTNEPNVVQVIKNKISYPDQPNTSSATTSIISLD